MKHLFVLFVTAHLLLDLAMPSLPGAFRFDPDQSVLAVRVQPVGAQEMVAALPVTWGQNEVESSRLALTERNRLPRAPALPLLLPRRDPSSEASSQDRSEDH